jgi:hypothetical protein
MKRTLFTAAVSSILVLAAPGMAVAAHKGKRHDRIHHATARGHAKRAHLVRFGARLPAAANGSTVTQPSTEPSALTEKAGTVVSFANGVLTIALNDGSKVSGKVTKKTELACQPATPPTTAGEGDLQAGDDQSASDGGELPGPSSEVESSGTQGGGSQDGDDQGSPDQGNPDQGNQEEEESCSTTALVPGASVGEAELRVSSSASVWEKVDLIQ